MEPSRREFLALAGAAAASTAVRLGASPSPAGTAGEVRRLTAPGFLDLQVNGFAGVDFNDPATTVDDLHRALGVLRSHGVTRILPTLITSSAERFDQCARLVLGVKTDAIAGIHMEGPYISPEDGPRGAHPREFTASASIDDFKRRQDAAGGHIRLVTLAPEVPGALPLIEYLRANGIRVGIGHTAASADIIRDAIKAGATLSTHLGNGAAQMIPRHPNFIWEQLAADEMMASLIVDGHHLPPATVKTMIRAKGVRRTILVTDAMAAAGQPPGEYQLGSVKVRLDDTGRVAIPGSPGLAGSALAMDRAVANTVRFAGVSLDDALAMASTNPAAYLGVKTAGTLHLEWDPDAFTLRVAMRRACGASGPRGPGLQPWRSDARGNRAMAAAPTQRDDDEPGEPGAVAAGDIAKVSDEHRRHGLGHAVGRDDDAHHPAEDAHAEQLGRHQRDDQVLAAQADAEDRGEQAHRGA